MEGIGVENVGGIWKEGVKFLNISATKKTLSFDLHKSREKNDALGRVYVSHSYS